MRLRVWVHNVTEWYIGQESKQASRLPPAVTWTSPIPSPGLDISVMEKVSHLENKT
jgi:hypothetical protein